LSRRRALGREFNVQAHSGQKIARMLLATTAATVGRRDPDARLELGLLPVRSGLERDFLTLALPALDLGGEM
jgi:hypothetical protein